MLIFIICATLVMFGINSVYNKGKRSPVEMSGIITEKGFADYVESVKGGGKYYTSLKSRLTVSIKIDQVPEPCWSYYVGQTFSLVIPDEEAASVKEGDRAGVVLKRFVNPGGEFIDDYRRIWSEPNWP